MKLHRSWSDLANTPARVLKRRQDKLFVRYLREELYALSPHYRRVLDEAGLDLRRVRGVRDLPSLPFTTAADLEADGARFRLTPTPRAMREHWGFSRKLALSLGGGRAGQALRRGYEPLAELPAGSPLASMGCSSHDLDVLAEVGQRAALQVGLGPKARLVSTLPRTGPVPGTLAEALLAGVAQLDRASSMDGPILVQPQSDRTPHPEEILTLLETEEASALLGTAADLEALALAARETGRSFPHLSLILVAGRAPLDGSPSKALAEFAPGARVARVHARTDLPMAFVESPLPPQQAALAEGGGFVLHPDLCVVEVIDPRTEQPVEDGQPGEVVYTSLAAHGRALLRYRTGDWTEEGMTWEPNPEDGCTLPRLSSKLRSMPV